MVLATRALLVLAVIGTVASVVCMRHQYYVFVLHDGGLTRGRSNWIAATSRGTSTDAPITWLAAMSAIAEKRAVLRCILERLSDELSNNVQE